MNQDEYLTGKDYPELCEVCRSAIDGAATILFEFGAIENNLYFENEEAACDYAYDRRWLCSDSCWKDVDDESELEKCKVLTNVVYTKPEVIRMRYK